MNKVDILERLERFSESPVIKAIFAFVGSALQWLFGLPDIALKAFLTCLAIDLFTGIFKAAKAGHLESLIAHEKGRKKYTFYALVLVLATMLDRAGLAGMRNSALLWGTITEVLSIIENWKEAEWPLFLKVQLTEIREQIFTSRRGK